jgi:hypothetical protein
MASAHLLLIIETIAAMQFPSAGFGYTMGFGGAMPFYLPFLPYSAMWNSQLYLNQMSPRRPTPYSIKDILGLSQQGESLGRSIDYPQLNGIAAINCKNHLLTFQTVH